VAQSQPDRSVCADLYRAGLELSRRLGHARGTATGLLGLGCCLADEGRAAEAEPLFVEALAICEGGVFPAFEAFSRERLGRMAIERDELARAEDHLAQAAALADRVGNLTIVGLVRYTCGWLKFRQGDLAAARHEFELSQAAVRAFGAYPTTTALAIDGLGHVAAAQGDTAAARAYFLQLLGPALERGSPYMPCMALEGLAHVAFVEGDCEHALYLASCAVAGLEAIGMPVTARSFILRSRWQAAREAIGQPAADRAWEAGRHKSVDQVLAEVLATA
jgi:tetratricopeptide (TPR) repeat protein